MNLTTPIKKIQIVLFLFVGMTSFQYSNTIEKRETIEIYKEASFSGEEQTEWNQIVSFEGVQIFYKFSNENDCDKFLLRIDNTSNQNKEIVFGVAGSVSDAPCRDLYASIDDYRVRKIVVEAFDELVGDESTPNLFILIPSNVEPIEDLIQNLQIKTI